MANDGMRQNGCRLELSHVFRQKQVKYMAVKGAMRPMRDLAVVLEYVGVLLGLQTHNWNGELSLAALVLHHA